MIGVVYLGTNSQTEERLKYIPGRLVQLTKNYKATATACAPHVRNEHFIVFYEKSVRNEDITAITYHSDDRHLVRGGAQNLSEVWH